MGIILNGTGDKFRGGPHSLFTLVVLILQHCMAIQEIPQDLFDAIEIDGGNMFYQIWHVVIPLSMPIIGTLGILSIIGQWNNFVSPLLYLRDTNLQTIAVALLHLEGEYTKNWGQLMAGYTIASIPLVILFIFCMKLFIRGLSSGAVKG